MSRQLLLQTLLPVFLFAILAFGGVFLLPWQKITWGNMQITPGNTITVTGESQIQTKNQIAYFTAGVNATNDTKDAAVSEVNQKMDVVLASVKEFGIKDADIQTQTMSVYQQQDTYYDTDGKQKTRPGQWQVANSVQLTLREVDRASALTDLLTQSGATNIYGPNFSLDSTKDLDEKLLQEAIDDAKKKAEIMAKASGRKVGKILSINEGLSSGGIIPYAKEATAGGGGASIQPGSTTTSKTVSLVFELK